MKKYFVLAVLAVCTLAVSCKKNNGPVDDGKIDPSTIAQSSLVAYIPFDGSAEETISKATATKTGAGVSYTTGRRGQALKGAENGYVIFNLPGLNKMTSFSIAAWINQPTIPGSQVPVPCYISFLNADNFWNDFAISIDRRDDDFLTYKLYWKSEAYDVWKTSNGSQTDENGKVTWDWGTAYPANRWAHIIWTYNETNSEFHTYVNGVDVTPEAYVATVANEAPAGAIHFHSFTQVMINGWRQKALEGATDEWMGWMNGAMDELRIYNKGLSATEAKDLYDAEVTQL